jgi:arylsulfatase
VAICRSRSRSSSVWGAGAAVGADPGSPTTPHYEPPFRFTGTIARVQVDTSGEAVEDKAAKFRALLARQ